MTIQQTHTPTRRLTAIAIASAWAVCGVVGCAATTPLPTSTHANLACDELPDARMNPLSPEAGNVTVSVLTLEDLPGVPDEWEPNRVTGVKASIPAPPGWSRAFVERKILCYRAIAAADEGTDPLLVKGSTISVRETRGRLEVSVTSEEPEIAQRIVDSVHALPPAPKLAAFR